MTTEQNNYAGVQCRTCGFGYLPEIEDDRRLHAKLHRRAVAAQTRLAGVGPVPLPLSYQAREALKMGEKLVNIMWSHFARSLDAWDYDLKRHPTWQRYARAYLADPTAAAAEYHPRQYKRLCAQFGVEPSTDLQASGNWQR